MKKRNLLLYGLVFMVTIGCSYSNISKAEPIQNSNKILNLELIYSSNAINEVPFFASDRIVVESGDNHNDFLIIIPFDGFDISPDSRKQNPDY